MPVKMGILTVLWEKWVEFRRDFYKITLAAMIAPLLYILVVWSWNPDHVARTIVSELSDSGSGCPDDHERQFQCYRPEFKRPEIVRKSI